MRLKPTVLLTLLMLTPVGAAAADSEEVAVLRHTVSNLLAVLVESELLTDEKAKALVAQARQQATQEIEAQEPRPGDVRVAYVPEVVREEITRQVADEVRDDVVADVVDHARQQRWGVPDALPGWLSRIEWGGELRLRAESVIYDSENPDRVYFDFQAINQAGGVGLAQENAFINTTEDRTRLRARVRLDANVDITDNLSAGVRLTTGNEIIPVTVNETLETDTGEFNVAFEYAYLNYEAGKGVRPWLTLQGGRIPNPFLRTELTFDNDLRFEGLSGTFRTGSRADSPYGGHFFLTGGAFPLQEVDRFSDDKWLYAVQLGGDWRFATESRLRIGAAYFDYDNIVGVRNEPLSNLTDVTAPRFVQRGNTLFDIRNDNLASTNLFALAGDYDIVNLTGRLDLARFDPIIVSVAADWLRNVGWDTDEVFERTGQRISEEVDGYHLELSVGRPRMERARDWRVFTAFRHVERDAILDAFTDSNFLFGGTDAEGYILGGEYGLTDRTWLQLRLISADEIDGPPLGIDVWTLDLNAHF